MLFRNLTINLGMETGCQGGQGSPRAVAPSEEEVGNFREGGNKIADLIKQIILWQIENL
jgi:hypothetical protein